MPKVYLRLECGHVVRVIPGLYRVGQFIICPECLPAVEGQRIEEIIEIPEKGEA